MPCTVLIWLWKNISHWYTHPQTSHWYDMLPSTAFTSNKYLGTLRMPKYLNLTTLICLCHAARSRTILSRPSFGYLDQIREPAPIEKWHFQYQPKLNAPSYISLLQNHRLVCHCDLHQHQNPSTSPSYRSLGCDEADSTDSTDHTLKSVGSVMGWDFLSIVSSCPTDTMLWEDLLHNCQSIR